MTIYGNISVGGAGVCGGGAAAYLKKRTARVCLFGVRLCGSRAAGCRGGAGALLVWLHGLEAYFPGEGIRCLVRVLGIALVAQFAADLCREAGLAAAASAVDLCGRALALLQALPLLQQLLDGFAGYLQ